MRVETGWILFAQEKKLIQCPRRKKSRRLKKVWQCFGFNFRRPLPLWYFYWGSLYKPLVNYWGQPTFILKMLPNIKTFPRLKRPQSSEFWSIKAFILKMITSFKMFPPAEKTTKQWVCEHQNIYLKKSTKHQNIPPQQWVRKGQMIFNLGNTIVWYLSCLAKTSYWPA